MNEDAATQAQDTRETGRRLLIATTIPVTIRAFLLPYADYFRTQGWRVDAMANGITGQEDLKEHFDNLIDIDWSRNPLDPGNLFGTPAKISKLVAENGYDIVHVHTPVAAFVTRFALRKLRQTGKPKVVYTAHGFHFYRGGSRMKNWIFRTLEKWAGKWTDRLIVINKEDYEAARTYKIIPEESLISMPGIGLDFSRYDRNQISREEILNVRTELGLKEDDVLFTMIAEFNPGKCHCDAIAALAQTNNPKIHLVFAGDGQLKSKMQGLAKDTGVGQRTHFMGYVKDPRPLILASRATINTSEREGLSRSSMESACLGVPIIGTNARGVRDAVEPDRGLLYPVGDPLALRDAMLQMAEKAYGEVEPDEGWRIESLLKTHDALYSNLISYSHGGGTLVG